MLLYEKYCSFIFYHISLLITHFNEWNYSSNQKIIWSSDTHNIGIQMKRKELTKTFVMISNWQKNIGPHDFS